MGETTMKSPGVTTTEIDLSGPSSVTPIGTPAGIIGTARQGPAFVPVTFATWDDFKVTFGKTDSEKFGPLAFYEWMNNGAQAGTYLRVLGAGDGKKKLSSDGTDSNSQGLPAGSVKNAGFIVGAQQVKENGYIGENKWATAASSGNGGAALGRTYFLGAFMSESAGSKFLSDAGLQPDNTHANAIAAPILRGVVMVPSGVQLALSGNYNFANTGSVRSWGSFASSSDGGGLVGAIDISDQSRQTFTMILNGFIENGDNKNIITASLNAKNDKWLDNVLNTDPTKIEERGHYLYSSYRVEPEYAYITGSGLVSSKSMNRAVASITETREEAVFILTSSQARGDFSTDTEVPNFECFTTRFNHASAPWVVSQEFGGKNKNLFKIHALDDGAGISTLYKISIEGLKNSKVDDDYGKFNLMVRQWNDTDENPEVISTFSSLNLDPGSDNYIARRIGNQNQYFDFDKKDGAQKLVVEGSFTNQSRYIRVEMNSEVEDGTMTKTALPVGFRGPKHLVTSGSSIMITPEYPGAEWNTPTGIVTPGGVVAGGVWGARLVEPPVPYRHNVSKGAGSNKTLNTSLYWGVQFSVNDSITEPNKSTVQNTEIAAYTRWYPDFNTGIQKAWVGDNPGFPDSEGTVYDCDKFNNNIFSLEKIQIHTSSASDVPDKDQWAAALYRRTGVLSASFLKVDGVTWGTGRFLNVSKDFGSNASQARYKFSFFSQGGFDGVDVFNEDKSKLLDNAAKREMDDSVQGSNEGPTVATYLKALEVMAEKSDVDIQVLAVPGIRETKITDTAVDKTEERFDAIYLMDIEERDSLNVIMTSSDGAEISVSNTVDNLKSRNLDSSFAAAYFPDLMMTDPEDAGSTIRVPPSVSVLGAFALNDKVAYPWYAPAGFTRGALGDVLETFVKLSRENMDQLYEVDINPITSFPNSAGVVVFGQKTLQAAASSLDRVNVRRLLIDIRRKVHSIADQFLFEPNRESTLANFSAAVEPILSTIQQQQGLDRYKVIIDTTTTTQADIENNTIRGKIFLQPTRSVEFISLDFVVTNNGTEI